jgi:flagellar hook assembly protein FlgD
LAVDQSFLSGPRSVVWDGKTSKGDWAAPGAYMFRIQTTGPSGESSVITRYFTVS